MMGIYDEGVLWRRRRRRGWGAVALVAASIVLTVGALVPAGERRGPLLAVGGLTRGSVPGMGGSVSCESCHQTDALFSHPMAVVLPGMKTTTGMPLQAGRMTCLTCHTEAPPEHGMARRSTARTGPNPMLRADSAEQLCSQCHTATRRNSAHTRGVSRAHLSWPDQRRGSGRGLFQLDVESKDCLSCHDGTVAQDVGIRASEVSEGSHASSHPVGVPQEPRLGRKSIAPMVPAVAVNHRVRLFDGNVGCGSCHSLYSKEEKLLVMSNFRSALCLSCHRE